MGFFLVFLTLVFVFYGIIKNSNPILINNENNEIIYDKQNDYEDKIKINNFIINDNDNEINNKNKNKEKEEEDDEK